MKRFSREPPDRDRDPAASMALLAEVLDPPLGPGYYSAAEARREAGLPASSGTRTWLMLAVSVLLGFTLTVAAATLRAPDPAAAEGRSQLIERIQEAQAAGDEQRAQVDQLRGEILALEQLAVAGLGPEAEQAIAEAGVQAGAQAALGPGVVITLDDAVRPIDDVPGGDSAPERINARDLQIVVNGMWAAGAEAISINGHRLTSMSAIRYAGQAIIVDFRALNPPYEVRVIGDPQALEQEATTGGIGAYLAALRRELALRAEVDVQDEIVVVPAERLITRVSTVPGEADDQPAQRRNVEDQR